MQALHPSTATSLVPAQAQPSPALPFQDNAVPNGLLAVAALLTLSLSVVLLKSCYQRHRMLTLKRQIDLLERLWHLTPQD